ncbi:hypothetical protein BDQ17DRAFT_1335877 [Cyathus striatus]|nr:hypothetical protein BDQ17DRAFT_1335877 [Cyathus striatus]
MAHLTLSQKNSYYEVTWTARTGAVYGQNRLIIGFLSLIGVMLIILAAKLYNTGFQKLHISVIHCTGSTDNPLAVHLLSIFTVIFELVSALLTTIRAVQALCASSWKWQRDSLMYFILEQGILYFIFVSGFATTSMVLDFPGTYLQTVMSVFTIPISGLMTARFLLHLREWEVTRSIGRVTTAMNPLDEMVFNHDTRNTAGERVNGQWSMEEYGDDPVQRYREGWAMESH